MPGKRLDNSHKYPAANRQPRQDAKFRKDEAIERQAAYDLLSVEEKIARLDAKLGVGIGATKQRAKLQALLDGKNKPETIGQMQSS